jgi:hypothetical protein
MSLENSVGGSGNSIVVVSNYSALPLATTVTGLFYWCSNSQGTKWLPGSLGGTYYNSGMYYSNGANWEFLNVPYQATQPTVDAGINNDQFLTSFTFENASKWTTKQAVLVSGTNIKTINGVGLLGSGDLIVSGGATNLTLTQSATNVIVNSDTGADATIPLGNGTNSGVSLNDYTTAEKSKLAGVAIGATANSSDATLLNRTNHTGTQLASTISDIQTTITNNTSVVANTAKVTNATHTGEVTGATVLTIATNIVNNAKLAQMGASTFKANNTGVLANAVDITVTQAKTLLAITNADVSGLGTLSTQNGTFTAIPESNVVNLISDLAGKQTTLVSGTNLRTVNGNTLLGSTDITVQPTLVSATNIKTINGLSVLGSGDLVVTGAGGMTRVISTVTAGNITAGSTVNTDYVYYVTDGSSVTLPTAIGNTNRYTIIRIGASTVSIPTTLSQTINGVSAPLNLTVQYASVDLMSNGTNWFIH